jgi:hypothetical protein
MKDFVSIATRFHSLCNEKHVTEAINVIPELADSANTVDEYVALGFCLARIGLFEPAEQALDLAWPYLDFSTDDAVKVAYERATVKYHLGKIAEGAAIEELVCSRKWFRFPSLADPAARVAVDRICREALLEREYPVEGKRVFVITCGGFGDQIEQLRNVDHLVAEGASVVFADPPEPLRGLIAESALPVTLTPASVDNLASCDALALGNILNLRYYRDGKPPASRKGYLRRVRERRPAGLLSAAMASKLKIGIVWRSINSTWAQCRLEPFRSMDLEKLEPLLASSGHQFLSLQYGDLTGAEQAILARYRVGNAAPHIRSFADLADIVSQLDLVITVDSGPAHLCGALDVPVWNLLSHVADWRWGGVGERSTALYPSMRLFRQPALGDWAPVIAEVAAELARL